VSYGKKLRKRVFAEIQELIPKLRQSNSKNTELENQAVIACLICKYLTGGDLLTVEHFLVKQLVHQSMRSVNFTSKS